MDFLDPKGRKDGCGLGVLLEEGDVLDAPAEVGVRQDRGLRGRVQVTGVGQNCGTFLTFETLSTTISWMF